MTSNKVEAWNHSYGLRSDANVLFWGTLYSFKREEALAVQKFHEESMLVRDQPAEAYEGTSRQITQRDKVPQLKNVFSKAESLPRTEYLKMLSKLIQEWK
jgi:hypothetical protein